MEGGRGGEPAGLSTEPLLFCLSSGSLLLCLPFIQMQEGIKIKQKGENILNVNGSKTRRRSRVVPVSELVLEPKRKESFVRT